MEEMIILRDVQEDDLPVFMRQHRDREAYFMAALDFTEVPADDAQFMARWQKYVQNPGTVAKTILAGDEIAGYIYRYGEDDEKYVCVWLGKDFWGRQIATQALRLFIEHCCPIKALNAVTAKDNVASRRVLEKCGFGLVLEYKTYSNMRGGPVEACYYRY